MTTDTITYDFAWGADQGEGVWYDDDTCLECCVWTADAADVRLGDAGSEARGDYRLASAIEFGPGQMVLTEKNEILMGDAARSFIRKRRILCKASGRAAEGK